ncbi:hypothetical protein [Mycolicibacterium goodii]|nr:hypothetical protein [Mycolicibacterium goodii]
MARPTQRSPEGGRVDAARSTEDRTGRFMKSALAILGETGRTGRLR